MLFSKSETTLVTFYWMISFQKSTFEAVVGPSKAIISPNGSFFDSLFSKLLLSTISFSKSVFKSYFDSPYTVLMKLAFIEFLSSSN